MLTFRIPEAVYEVDATLDWASPRQGFLCPLRALAGDWQSAHSGAQRSGFLVGFYLIVVL